MKLQNSTTRVKYLAPFAIAFLLYLLGPAGAAPAPQLVKNRSIPEKVPSRMLIPGTQDVQLIVELSAPSALERMNGSASSRQTDKTRPVSDRNRSMDFATPQALSFRQQIRQTQETIKNRILTFPGAQILGSTDIVMNAILVRVHAEHYGALRRLPGVKRVYFSRPQRMLLDQAAIIQNAQGLWTAAGGRSQAGQGVKIGLIDTGIDITNPMFDGSGYSAPSGYPKYDTQADSAYTNNKVIVARNYISLLSNPQLIQTAVDEVGHGTFVAGCAGGEQVTAPRATISGMAPGAYLGNYKVFGTPGINDTATTAAVLAAINDAVADGMNVINLSLGSLDYVPPDEDAEAIALGNAVQAGVVVTIAAGNNGSMTHSISSPGTAPGAITAGSVTSDREFLALLHTTDPGLSTIGYLPSGDGPSVTSNLSFTKIVDVEPLDGDGLGCSALSSATLAGAIALVERGTCTFATKVNNVAAAGAIAAVVYNNASSGLVAMAGLSATTIPAVMISQADGEALKQYIDANPASAQAAIDNAQTLESVPTTSRVVSAFSSVGPGTDFSIKPDLVAVGENLYSATEKTHTSGLLYDPSGFTVSQGTSFSAPMAAGAAASLRERFPALGASAIKSLLTSTASRNLTADGANPPDILEAGSGLLDMGNAASSVAAFAPTSLNFGVHPYSGSLSLSESLTIQNISSNSDQFTLGVEPIIAGPSVTFSQSNTGAMAPGSTMSIDVMVQASAPSTGGFQGFITVQSSSTSAIYRIPYWAGLYVPDSTRVLQVSQSSSDSGVFDNLADALAAAQPGNIIEIEDSATYPAGPGGLTISTNSQGVPLHGITIRAAVGQTPVIDGTSLGSSGSPSNILIVGLHHVLLQGLTINGGYTGIELYQPSTAVPLSATIDHCTVSNSTGDIGAAGVWIDGGGTVDITHSIISASSGTGIVAGAFSDGTQLTLLDTTVQGNGNDGLDAYGSNVDILNSTFTGNYGAEAYLDFCTGTIEGNTFSLSRSFFYQGQPSYGDGIQIADGNLLLKNNLIDSNDEAAIGLFPGDLTGLGPTVRIEGNTMRNNGFYGIYAVPAPSLLADGNLIEDNAGGIYLDSGTGALLRNNIIVRSTDTGAGDGLEVAGSSNARLVNNTIYQNKLHGVRLTSGTVTVANSIVYGNAQGDLSGVAPGSVQSSLVSVNPSLVNPAADDFSLATGSAAIDAGSNTVADLPFLDYNGRLRIASATAPSGRGTADAGAEESHSAYPLVYPLVVNGNQTSLGGALTTGIAVSNPGSTAAQADFTGYNGAGGALAGSRNPSLQSFGPEAQIPILDWQLFGFDEGDSALGSMLVASDSALAGFYLICDPDFSQFATGANAPPEGARDVVFMKHRFDASRTTSYVIFNPGNSAANVTAALYNSAGSSIGQPQTVSIGAKGQAILGFDSANLSSGYVRVQSDRPVSGLELIGGTNRLSALGGFSPTSETQLYFQHLAVGGGYSTEIGIVNTGAAAVNLAISAYDTSGNPLGSNAAITLPAGGQLLQTASDLFGIAATDAIQTGYIVARGDQPGIMGFSDFIYSDGVRDTDAAIPADSLPSAHLFFSHIAQGINSGTGVPYQTGIALLNPFGTKVGYTMRVFDGTGALIGQTSGTLGPHQQVAKFLTSPVQGVGFFTQSYVLGNGHVEVDTDYWLLGLELFFTEDLSQLASVPAQ